MNSSSPLIIENIKQNTRTLIPLAPSEKKFDEAWLQELIFRNPSLLPCHELDASYDKIIPLGREISVTSGNIDNLFITHQGRLVVVETKLWRNPDAHRTVLAQIIDYAKDLVNTEYKELEDKVKRFYTGLGQNFTSIYRHVKPRELDEAAFLQAIHRSLKTGDFLLLIVGDKIRPEVVLLKDVLQVAPHLEFTIGLVELKFFRATKEDWPLIVVPSVVGRTYEITRSVVKIRYENKKPEVSVSTFEESLVTQTRTNPETFLKSVPSEFEDIFRTYIDKWSKATYHIYWGKIGFSIKVPFKGGRLKSVIDVYPESISVFKKEWLAEWDNPIEAYQKYRQKTEVITEMITIITSGKRYVYYERITVNDLSIILEATDELALNLFKNYIK